jgi:hypothetical protein
MPTRLKVFAIAAVLAAGTSNAAMAQYACPARNTYYNGVCQPAQSPGLARSPGYSNRGTANLTRPAPPCVGARLNYGYCYPFSGILRSAP